MSPSSRPKTAAKYRRSRLTGLLWVGIGFFIGHFLREEPSGGLLMVAVFSVVLGLIGYAVTWGREA